MKKILHCMLICLLLQQFAFVQKKSNTINSTTLDEVVITAFEKQPV